MPVKEANSDYKVIVIGAGAAGLMAARELSDKGYKIIILEAGEHPGGRVRTIHNNSFIRPIEEGAEFIHGKLPFTFQLLKDAGIHTLKTKGHGIRVINGQMQTNDGMPMGWNELIAQLKNLKEDMTIDRFLKKYFRAPQFSGLSQFLRGFSEGFDAADTTRASALAFSKELTPGIHGQYRINGGYQQLIQFLESQCKAKSCDFFYSCVAKKILWQKDAVNIIAADGNTFSGQKVIITVPLGVLQATETEVAAINFEPDLDRYKQAAMQMGYGSVIKILLQFNNPFWEKKKRNLGFIFSGEIIPTWWTQFPESYPLLTGWLGGPKALAMKASAESDILKSALQSLGTIFNLDEVELRQMLTAWHIANWHQDPFALGGYSYQTVETRSALALMNTPVEGTLFFSGEACYDGPLTGTVEAALASGKMTAQKILR